MDRRSLLYEAAKARRAKLEESRKLQQFLQDVEETCLWIAEKNKSACDESYWVSNPTKVAILRICHFAGPDKLTK